MARYGRLLTDAQWEKIRPLLPKRPPRPRGGRPPAPDRKVLEGILWILRSGPRWQDLPTSFPRLRPAGGGCGTGRSKDSG
jgi:transposase